MNQDIINNKPRDISAVEWQEIINVPQVREGWGLFYEEKAEDFAASVYGAKFNFISGSPGYCGDVYILLGDALSAPMLLYRKNGKLEYYDPLKD